MLLFVCIFSLTTVVTNSALAFTQEPCLIYDGRQKEFSFVNVKDGDLFQNFKKVMPGDTISQTVVIKGENIETKADLYLLSETEGNIKTSDDIDIMIFKDSELLFNSSLNNSENPSKNTLLHTFSGDEDIELLVVLKVPVTVGNEVAGKMESVKWTFAVQEAGDMYLPENPKTGDSNEIILYVLIAIISLVGISFTSKKIKETKKEEIEYEK